MDHHLGTFGHILGSKSDPFLNQKTTSKIDPKFGTKNRRKWVPKVQNTDPPGGMRVASGAVKRHIFILTCIDNYGSDVDKHILTVYY